MPATASADVNDFTVTNFTSDYYLNNNDPQGEMRVVEKISVNFTDNNHGILRAIPESYKGHPLHLHINQITSDTQAPTQYSTSSSNGNEVLKIGSPTTTVTGTQEYTLDYAVKNVISFYPDHDELYWDVNGDQWNQPFTSVTATLHLAPGMAVWSKKPVCYAGTYGTTSENCVVTNGSNLTFSTSDLQPQFTLTFVVGFQKGYFHPYTWRDELADYIGPILELILPVVLLGGTGFVWWFKRGRDAKGRGTIIPEYDAPDGLSPLEVGTIADFTVDNRDLTATIIDLAIRKYLRIIETDGKKMLVVKTTSYSLQLINRDWSGLNRYEQQLLAALFPMPEAIDQVDIAALSTKLNSVAQSIKKSVSADLTTRGYFVSNPSKFITLPIVGMVIAGWVLLHLFGAISGWLIAGMIIGVSLLALFYHLLPARTAKGVAAKEHSLGLKMYLEVAEKDRIAKLQSPGAPYAANQAEPTRSVDLFEKLLPYAIVFKVEQKWADKFNDIYSAPPDWYVGSHYAVFNAGYLVGSLNGGFAQAVNSTFGSPSGSGGSGFGGGGFAGGGGGGGGGGGW